MIYANSSSDLGQNMVKRLNVGYVRDNIIAAVTKSLVQGEPPWRFAFRVALSCPWLTQIVVSYMALYCFIVFLASLNSLSSYGIHFSLQSNTK